MYLGSVGHFVFNRSGAENREPDAGIGSQFVICAYQWSLSPVAQIIVGKFVQYLSGG
jgi:hypothetical protein